MIGTLYGISVGPGDPELITVKALGLLQRSPVVAFPAGVGDRSGMAEKIIQPWLHSDQTQLPLTFPYVQDSNTLQEAWTLAAEHIWHYLKTGQDVVFACEGDVSFYSTFTYLAQTLQVLHPNVTVEAVPGVCSPLAAAASLGLPLTIRQQKLIVIPALYNLTELETALAWTDVVVLMKVSSVYAQVWQVLDRCNLLDRSYVVEWATLPQQRVFRGLQSLPDLQLHYFSLLIVQASRPDTP